MFCWNDQLWLSELNRYDRQVLQSLITIPGVLLENNYQPQKGWKNKGQCSAQMNLFSKFASVEDLKFMVAKENILPLLDYGRGLLHHWERFEVFWTYHQGNLFHPCPRNILNDIFLASWPLYFFYYKSLWPMGRGKGHCRLNGSWG